MQFQFKVLIIHKSIKFISSFANGSGRNVQIAAGDCDFGNT